MNRVNFAADQFADPARPGVRSIIDRIMSLGQLQPDSLVDSCLDFIGPLDVSENTRTELVEFAAQEGPFNSSPDTARSTQRITEMLNLIVATREYQMG